MRFMLLLKGDPAPGATPSEELIGAMLKFNEELAKSGVLLAAEGLHSSGHGARVQYLDGKRTVTDGPFTESKELVAGYYLIQVGSKEEAIEWASRCPVEYAVQPGQEAVVEVRLVADMSELPEATEDQVARQQNVRDQIVGG
ncbi:MAG TPA: dehydrogenase [Micromonosporaceae bacterium]|nr:dehydrogenase [Micromonosporaceae bacterium]